MVGSIMGDNGRPSVRAVLREAVRSAVGYGFAGFYPSNAKTPLTPIQVWHVVRRPNVSAYYLGTFESWAQVMRLVPWDVFASRTWRVWVNRYGEVQCELWQET